MVEKFLDVISKYRSDSHDPGDLIVNLVESIPELKFIPNNYLKEVFWAEFMGDQLGFQVEKGYVLYNYSIGDTKKFVVTRDLTSTVIRHITKYFLDYNEAYNECLKLNKESGGKHNGYLSCS